MTNARKRIAINVSVIGDECSIDRDGIGIKEGFDGDVDLVFTFNDPSSSDDADASWSDRPIRKISIINNERIYTSTLIGDEFTIPRHMLKRGKLLFIVRGFKNKESVGIVTRDGHLFASSETLNEDLPSYCNVSRSEHILASDSRVGIMGYVMNGKQGHIILSTSPKLSASHDIDEISDDNPDGYIEVSNIEDVIFITGKI